VRKRQQQQQQLVHSDRHLRKISRPAKVYAKANAGLDWPLETSS